MRIFTVVALLVLVSGCGHAADDALGTLERDRIALPAPVSERIAEIAVREGQQVAAGDMLMVLEPERVEARVQAAIAEQSRARASLDEARHGPRPAEIAEA